MSIIYGVILAFILAFGIFVTMNQYWSWDCWCDVRGTPLYDQHMKKRQIDWCNRNKYLLENPNQCRK